ncbi:MAG: penicillin-binding protein [Bacilli bacterium]|nr:penicillin-binding protein [Bacilli bacterium]
MKNTVKEKWNEWNAPVICFIIFFIIIIGLFVQFCYLSLSNNVYGINMKEFASNRNTVTSTLIAERGTIFDIEGNVLAQNISSYTLIAYLDSARTVDDDYPEHVVDKEYTATKLSSVLGEDNYEYILERLSKESKQVEFGNIGRNLTELTKLAIEELDLPGIDFTETVKRYYPNGDFASYVIGYAKQYTRINIKEKEEYNLYDYYKNYFNNYEGVTIEISDGEIISIEDKTIKGLKVGNSLLFIKTNGDTLATIMVNVTDYDNYQTMDSTIVGELGIESNFEEELQGIDGYIKYQQDKYGYKIPDTPEEKKESEDGYDIYLTIDSNIQRFAESAVNDLVDDYEPDWSIVTVMDAKDGAILASATSPSYNPNSLSSDMSYQNPLVSYTYEPGSVMKIYTYMCAIETGEYDGEKTYLSGRYEFEDGYAIHDWDKKGWGYLNYDSGFSYSSNVAIINIIKDYLSMDKLKTCLENYGFNSKTGIELSNEEKGSISYKYETELMSAGFGQGISTTAVQQLQALTIVANDGVMVKPHIISKIVDSNTGKEKVTEIEKSEKLVSSSTINKIKDLMESVVQPESPTGSKYYLEGYDIIGKTGTAQIFENGAYLTGSNDYIVSIALMYPKDDPEIIIYAAAKRPSNNANLALPSVVPELIKNISKYKGMFSDTVSSTDDISYDLKTYISKDIASVKEELKSNGISSVVIGDGSKIIKQYPSKGTNVIEGDKVFLVTNGSNFTMPDISNWSRYDVIKLCEYLDIEYAFDGYGYVASQSIKAGTQIKENMKLEVLLGNIKPN